MTARKIKPDSIFISIASYRDSELIPTILDCVVKAHKRKRLFFGICLQDDINQYFKLKHLKKKYRLNLKIIFCDWKDSQGACWARYLIQKKLYHNQYYYLQLDSHHRFIEQWDEVLIHMLHKKKTQGHNKPIIGGYCPGYHANSNKCDDGGIQISSFDTFTHDGDLIFRPMVLNPSIQKTTTSIPARFLSGHFIFTDGGFCKECLYDPNLYFRGEEITLSVRAYTNGYSLFHPSFPIIWHFYLRPKEQKHWDNHQNGNGFIINTNVRDTKAKERVRKLLGIESNNINFGHYGLGNQKTLHEYELYAGLSFKNKQIHKYCANTRNDAPLPFNMSEDEWNNGMLMKKLIVTTIPQSLVAEINSKLQFIIMCIEDHKNILLYRHDLKHDELAMLMKNNLQWKKEIGIENIPTHVVFIPFYNNNSFGQRIKSTEVLYYDVN